MQQAAVVRERSFVKHVEDDARKPPAQLARRCNACRVRGNVTPSGVYVTVWRMRTGYGRVSTRDQHPDAQHDALAAAGCEQIFIDKASGKLARRPELDKALLSANRSGDQLVITKLDRLGRSLEHLIELSRLLQTRGVDLVVLDQGIDTSTAVGRMFFQVLGAIAEFEHALMSERTLDGLAAARARGRTGGQRPKLGPRQIKLARQMYDETGDDGKRKHTVAQIAAEFGVSRPTIYRHLTRSTESRRPPGPERDLSFRCSPRTDACTVTTTARGFRAGTRRCVPAMTWSSAPQLAGGKARLSPQRRGGRGTPADDPGASRSRGAELTEGGDIQYHLPRANPPNAMSPMSATMRPIQKFHTNIRTIPTMTIIPPAEIPADPRPPFGDPAMRISLQCWMQSISLPVKSDPLQAPQQALFRSPGASLRRTGRAG